MGFFDSITLFQNMSIDSIYSMPFNSFPCFGSFSSFNIFSNFNTSFLSTPSLNLFNSNFNNNYWGETQGDLFIKSDSSSTLNRTKKPTTKKTSFSTPAPKYLSSTKNIQWWIDKGYNPQKGKKLCAATKKHLDANIIGCKKNGGYIYREHSECVGYVRKGINDAFYNGNQHYNRFGKAYLCGEQYLSNDTNFKKLTGVDMSTINPVNIPEGAVVIYNQGYSRGKGAICGHGEVSNGNGQGYSDVLTRLKNSGHQTIREIWLPV